MNAFHNPTQYMINEHYKTTMTKLESIQQYIVSLVDRILKVVELCLRLTEDPVHPSRTTTPTPKSE